MALLAGGAALLASCATGERGPGGSGPGVQAGTRYVAMGSSYAAGPGVPTSADQPANRCARSTGNYAHVLAQALGLQLTDVSCSGATTAHLIGPWSELPPQVEAVTADTGLVTITIGGNDVGFVGALGSASCRSFAVPPPGTPGGKCPTFTVAPDAWSTLDTALRAIVAEVRRRAPAARIVFVDYVTVLPERGGCAALPLPPGQAEESRAVARRLAALTATVAADTGSELFAASALSRGHDACSAEPWVTGFPLPGGPGFVPYHPNARGMAAIGQGLARRLARRLGAGPAS
jgi:lysophospholipase L1-like esterase